MRLRAAACPTCTGLPRTASINLSEGGLRRLGLGVASGGRAPTRGDAEEEIEFHSFVWNSVAQSSAARPKKSNDTLPGGHPRRDACSDRRRKIIRSSGAPLPGRVPTRWSAKVLRVVAHPAAVSRSPGTPGAAARARGPLAKTVVFRARAE